MTHLARQRETISPFQMTYRCPGCGKEAEEADIGKHEKKLIQVDANGDPLLYDIQCRDRLKPAEEVEEVELDESLTRRQEYTKKYIVKTLAAILNYHGDISQAEWDRRFKNPHSSTVHVHLGGWARAKKLARKHIKGKLDLDDL